MFFLLKNINKDGKRNHSSILSSFSVNRGVWIGNNQSTSGEYIWVTGKKLGFTAWTLGEPSMSSNGCVYLWKYRTFKWDDSPCDLNKYFICEKKCIS